VILGLPGESRQDILETARVLSSLDLDGVKIHGLYVVEETPLADLFRRGEYRALDQRTYVEWVTAFLERLSPKVVIQRLTGDPDPATLLAPTWALKKQETLSLIQKTLEVEDAWQGRLA
jgi:radical SAM protein (TIGR01212 family)